MIKKISPLILKFLLVTSLYVGLQQLIEMKTRGFSLDRIQADDLSFQQNWETPPLSAEEEREVASLLSQSYRLIGSGSECFAFMSADGKAVIKFFKLDHIRPVYLHRGLLAEDHSALAGTVSHHPLTELSLPSPFDKGLKRILGIREFRISRTFNSLKLAYDGLKEETGILYLHLNPTAHLKQKITLYDGCGIAHEIDLDTTPFFLQRKAIPVEQHLAALKEASSDEEAKKSIHSLIDLMRIRCKKGYADRDILNRNLGFIGLKAIEIDSGSFFKNSAMREPWLYKQEIFYATLELKMWLKKHYPEMVSHLEQRVAQEIKENS